SNIAGAPKASYEKPVAVADTPASRDIATAVGATPVGSASSPVLAASSAPTAILSTTPWEQTPPGLGLPLAPAPLTAPLDAPPLHPMSSQFLAHHPGALLTAP